jgi:hypothetical protein
MKNESSEHIYELDNYASPDAIKSHEIRFKIMKYGGHMFKREKKSKIYKACNQDSGDPKLAINTTNINSILCDGSKLKILYQCAIDDVVFNCPEDAMDAFKIILSMMEELKD